MISQERSRNLGNQTIQNATSLAETNRLLALIYSKNSNMYVNGRALEQSTADDRDRVDGTRNRLVQRGLAVR